MVKLEKFEIVNYRSCLKATFDLQKDLTCLIGVNGVGKTNILKGIQLLKKVKVGHRVLPRRIETHVGSLTNISASFRYNHKLVRMKSTIRYETDDKNNDEVLDAEFKFNLFEFTGSRKWIQISAELLPYLDNMQGESRRLWKHFFGGSQFANNQEGFIIPIRNFLKRISYYSASQFSDPTNCPISFELEESKPYRQSRFNLYHEKFLNDLYLTYKRSQKLFFKFLSAVNKDGIGMYPSDQLHPLSSDYFLYRCGRSSAIRLMG